MFVSSSKPPTMRSEPLGRFAAPRDLSTTTAVVESTLALRPTALLERPSNLPVHVPETTGVLDRARSVGVPIRPVGVGTMPTVPLLTTYQESPWVVCPLDDDPLFKSGKFPIPRARRRDLQRLSRAGVTMDELFVAHELVPETVAKSVGTPAPGSVMPLTPHQVELVVDHPGPSRSTRRFTDTSGRIARAVSDGAIAAGSAAAVGAGALALLPFAVIDPIIFGARRLPHDPQRAVVFELVRWDW
jgi:hypothetical protein